MSLSFTTQYESKSGWLVSTDSAEKIEKWRHEDDVQPTAVLGELVEYLFIFTCTCFLVGYCDEPAELLAVGSFEIETLEES